MRLFQGISLLFALLLFQACEKEIDEIGRDGSPEVQADLIANPCTPVFSSQALIYTPGQAVLNTIMVDGIQREFLLYVPQNYNAWWAQTITYPVVYMFHGSGQQASRMLLSTSWEEEAEDHNLIIVYPQALEYDLNQSCPTQVRTKTAWETPGIQQKLVAGQTMADDIKFVKEIRRSLRHRMRTNCGKFYACGFSNGGSFVKTRIRVEMPQEFRATTSCGGIGLPGVYHPLNGIRTPHYEVIGNRDLNARRRFLCSATNMCCTPGNLDSDPNNWTGGPFWFNLVFMAGQCGIAPNASNITIAHNPAIDKSVMKFEDGPNLEYKFQMARALDHEFPGPIYANTPNCANCKDYTTKFWNWMSQF